MDTCRIFIMLLQSVIFDCCYSGSGTRSDNVDPGHLSRVVELDDNVPEDLDQMIWLRKGERSASIVPGFAHSGLRSHVLLAACGSGEKAKEDQERGYFTRTLLSTLRSVDADQVTYEDLLKRMPALPF